jgi:hypothetical protein
MNSLNEGEFGSGSVDLPDVEVLVLLDRFVVLRRRETLKQAFAKTHSTHEKTCRACVISRHCHA